MTSKEAAGVNEDTVEAYVVRQTSIQVLVLAS